MNMYDIIVKKRDGGKLSLKEISFFIEGYIAGRIPDYQAAALLMAIYFREMDEEETLSLTYVMASSGEKVDLSNISGTKVDKHSTGGVGDKTTLIVAPIAAACGVPIAKMSGRGLGFTGGTVDKMEAIPGFKTSLAPREFTNLVNNNGLAVIGQSAQIDKADKLLYALRDVTGTVESISLIASSIMSKKLAAGSDAIVLDVKCGAGAFMHQEKEAIKLAEIMVDIGRRARKKTIAFVTSMEQPLGLAVGNSLEVIEAIETLKGRGPKDLVDLSVNLAGMMIFLGQKSYSYEEGIKYAEEAIASGRAVNKLKDMIEGQGGDSSVIEDYSKFIASSHRLDVLSHNNGYVNHIKAQRIGTASRVTGAGRLKKGDSLDLSAGLIMNKKVSDSIKKGELLATLFGNNKKSLEEAAELCKKAFDIGEKRVDKNRLIIDIVGDFRLKNDHFLG